MKAVFLFGYVPTASMEPTLPEGSYILGLRIYGELEKGDIIIFKHDGKLLVKRIAALPGEAIFPMRIVCSDRTEKNPVQGCRKAASSCWAITRKSLMTLGIGPIHL